MTWEVRLSHRAVDDLASLPLAVRRRVVAKLRAAAEDPPRFFRRLVASKAHRLRVGDYRIIADLDASESVILVGLVDHRRNVYK